MMIYTSSFRALAPLLLLGLFNITSCTVNESAYYVNPNKLLKGYHGAITQYEAFQSKAKVWQQRVDSLNTELQALNKASTTTRAINEQQLMRYRDAIQKQAQQENQRLTKAVLEEMNTYLKQYGKQKGYRFIFGATESGNIVYAAEGTDITTEVLKGLNEQYDRQHPTAAP